MVMAVSSTLTLKGGSGTSILFACANPLRNFLLIPLATPSYVKRRRTAILLFTLVRPET